jgi:hypothetical protein
MSHISYINVSTEDYIKKFTSHYMTTLTYIRYYQHCKKSDYYSNLGLKLDIGFERTKALLRKRVNYDHLYVSVHPLITLQTLT